MANLVIWNPFKTFLATDDESLYKNCILYGEIVKVLLRGEIAYEKGTTLSSFGAVIMRSS